MSGVAWGIVAVALYVVVAGFVPVSAGRGYFRDRGTTLSAFKIGLCWPFWLVRWLMR